PGRSSRNSWRTSTKWNSRSFFRVRCGETPMLPVRSSFQARSSNPNSLCRRPVVSACSSRPHLGEALGLSWSLSRYGNIYTLIYEVPVKWPKCKESLGIDDFGAIDCPGCRLELALSFDETMQKDRQFA